MDRYDRLDLQAESLHMSIQAEVGRGRLGGHAAVLGWIVEICLNHHALSR